MKIRDDGKEHEKGNRNCPACGVAGDASFPQRCLKTRCPGLRHAESFGDLNKVGGTAILYKCDVCGEPV